MDGFETFDRVHSRIVKTPLVTIQVRGYMSLNLAAFEALKTPKAVEMLFNRAERIIGIRKVDPSLVHAVIVRKQANSPSYMVSARSFSTLYDIDTSVARRYKAEMQSGVLLIDLKQPSAIATGPNTKENMQRKRELGVAQSTFFEADDDVLAGVHSEGTTNVPTTGESDSQDAEQLRQRLLDALTRLDESSDPREIQEIEAELRRTLDGSRE